ncbi:MAG: hypothetical protein ACK5YO_38445, partial [Planctomyces sp.]
MHRGFRHQVDISALEAQLSPVFAMTVDERAALGARARAWFEAQVRRFLERLQVVRWDGTTGPEGGAAAGGGRGGRRP